LREGARAAYTGDDAPVIVVTGLAFEARIAAGPGVRVVCQQNTTLAATLEAVVAQGCRGLVSFGTAGGLIDALRPGSWIVARAVSSIDEPGHAGRVPLRRYETNAQWSQALLQTLERADHGDIAGVASPVVNTVDKRQLQRACGASAADMESHIVARIANVHSLPFVCARVVIDPADRTLPPAAVAALRDDGSTDIAAVLRSLIRQPGQLPALLAVARDARAAHRALADGRRKIGPGFGLA
jgi:hopanoid-associated phosphorylase